jgi:uncharacterized SAM-binding protein YcdF (DUF218 family)
MSALFFSLRLLFRLAFFACLMLVVGFVAFAASVKSGNHADDRKADGIVALTGGKARIGEAVRLLAKGNAKRMLITGVNPATTKEQLVPLVPEGGELFGCCIDLGREAEDTTGNAMETREWADMHGYKSLIVVTSSYHMPRTLLELRHVMPHLMLIPHSVEPDSFRSDRWWSDRDVMRLMVSEYVKYLTGLLRNFAGQMGIPVKAGRDMISAISRH